MPGKTLLVIDDDPLFRENLSIALKGGGYNVLEAADGAQAVRTIEQLRMAIDLMIVDLALPAIPGIEIVGTVSRKATPIKIIATSGVFDQTYLDMAKHFGAHESVHKSALPAPGMWLELVRHLIGEAAGAPEPPSNRLALVVDDDAPIREYVRTVLQRHGFQTLEAADGLDAISLLHRLGGSVDVIVSDVRMPKMDGPDFVSAFRIDFPHVPVVFISGDNLRLQLHRPSQRMFFVGKPFAPQVLLKMIFDALKVSPDA
jgi:CheY-like chemotaxis protein